MTTKEPWIPTINEEKLHMLAYEHDVNIDIEKFTLWIKEYVEDLTPKSIEKEIKKYLKRYKKDYWKKFMR